MFDVHCSHSSAKVRYQYFFVPISTHVYFVNIIILVCSNYLYSVFIVTVVSTVRVVDVFVLVCVVHVSHTIVVVFFVVQVLVAEVRYGE